MVRFGVGRFCRRLARGMVLIALLGSTSASWALPAFARQTGEKCIACHVSFPELTPFGRHFKLTGYTLGQRQTLMLALMAQVGMTHSSRPYDASGAEIVPHNNDVRLSGASAFFAGKITDNAGIFSQVSYDAFAHHTASDNIDLRAARLSTIEGKELIVGATLHNNPTLQDVWNSTPAFGFPYTASPTAITGPPVATLIDGGLAQKTAGLGGYASWDKSWYGELTLYRTADKLFSILRAGHRSIGDVSALRGYNPYVRVAYSRDWGANSLMVGAFGLRVEQYPDFLNPAGPTDRYTDTGLDSQYQYITDPYTFTAQATWIHERQDWTASGPDGTGVYSNATGTLNTFKTKATFYYRRKYGVSVGYFRTGGSADAAYDIVDADTGASVNNGLPDTRGYVAELNYLPVQNTRIMLQYVAFLRFNGVGMNIDGMGRRARDNNSLFLNLWVAY